MVVVVMIWYWPSRKVNQEDRNLFTHCDDHVRVGPRGKTHGGGSRLL